MRAQPRPRLDGHPAHMSGARTGHLTPIAPEHPPVLASSRPTTASTRLNPCLAIRRESSSDARYSSDVCTCPSDSRGCQRKPVTADTCADSNNPRPTETPRTRSEPSRILGHLKNRSGSIRIATSGQSRRRRRTHAPVRDRRGRSQGLARGAAYRYSGQKQPGRWSRTHAYEAVGSHDLNARMTPPQRPLSIVDSYHAMGH